MRIGFFAEHYPPTQGGVATSARRVALELVRQGADVQVFCFDSEAPIDSPDTLSVHIDEGVVVKRIAPFFLKQKTLLLLSISESQKATLRRRAFNQVIAELKREPVDVILSFYLLNAGFLAQYVARYFGLPVVAGVRGNDVGRNIFNFDRFAAVQWVVQGADRIVCVNQHLFDRLLLAFPEARAKTIIIPNSIAPVAPTLTHEQARLEILRRASWPDDTVILVFIGTLREKKGLWPVVSALERLVTTPLRLLVVGADLGPAERALCGRQWEALQQQQQRLFVTGALPRESVNDWAVGGDILLMPSIEDGMANGLLEGMALGLCPVVTDLFADVITDGVDGFLVPANDFNALAATLRHVSQDRTAAERIGEEARRTIEFNHAPPAEGSRYLGLLRELLLAAQN